MSGVSLGRRAHHYSSSGVNLWPISGQQPVYVTQKTPDQLSWNLDGDETNEVPGTRDQVPGTRYQGPETRDQRPGTRYLILVIETEEKTKVEAS